MAVLGMTVDDLNTELAAVNAAILRILNAGQSGSRAGVAIQRAQLSDLRQSRQDIIAMIQRSGGLGALIQTTIGPTFHSDGFINLPGSNGP